MQNNKVNQHCLSFLFSLFVSCKGRQKCCLKIDLEHCQTIIIKPLALHI
uniref:Uncharacterized protein n=1 Tax=Manihot esculenta TaxID=3983 RepID=A0A2C9VLI9_MANES